MLAASLGQSRGIFGPIRPRKHRGLFGLTVIRSLINPLQAFGDLLAIFPAAEVQGMAHKVHDAGLHCGVREGRVDGVREALEAVNNGDEDVLHPPVAQVVHDRQPELCPLVGGDPQAQDLAFSRF